MTYEGLRRTVKTLLFGAVAVLVWGACSSQPQADSSRLAILDDGNVVVLNADGSDRVVVTEQPADSYFQPTWSPDGSLLAFSGSAPDPAIFVVSSDGEKQYSTATVSFPFYFSWSVRNDLAFLSSEVSGLRLEVTSVQGEDLAEPRLVETGQPLYFSWNPEGTKFAAHVGPDRLDVNDLDSAQPLGPAPGVFQSPRWTEQGIVAVEQGPRDQRLTIVESDGTANPVAMVLGPTTFVATPDGSRLAVQSVLDGTGAVNAALQAVPALPPSRLVVVDTASGESVTATDGPVAAFFWSPDGEQLLVLDVVDGPLARWSVWSDDGLRELVRFDPEQSFVRDLLPFFDQYAQSVSLWAPDGSAFAFPGTVDGEAGIWVQALDGDLTRISGGTWVSWSP